MKAVFVIFALVYIVLGSRLLGAEGLAGDLAACRLGFGLFILSSTWLQHAAETRIAELEKRLARKFL